MRRAAVAVSIKGHDVTLDLMPYLVSLTYTDKADEELDDLQIVLEDREGLWQGDWLPQAGDVIEASIQTEKLAGDRRGRGIALPGSSRWTRWSWSRGAEGGDTRDRQGRAAAVKSSLMLQKKTRSWEKTADHHGHRGHRRSRRAGHALPRAGAGLRAGCRTGRRATLSSCSASRVSRASGWR